MDHVPTPVRVVAWKKGLETSEPDFQGIVWLSPSGLALQFDVGWTYRVVGTLLEIDLMNWSSVRVWT